MLDENGKQAADVVVAGHICLDVIPQIGERSSGLREMLVPGKLVNVGAAVTSTGGAVSNTGLALHRLGVSTRLMGKVGEDLFGGAIMDIIRGYGDDLAEGMIVSSGEHSSYTVVINPPGLDRIFLHCTGANDTFRADDVPDERLEGARLFHFGYPPLMRGMYVDGGAELVRLMKRVKAMGLTTTLDFARPDPDSEAGRVDWRALLERVLPHVDAFLPSFEEIMFMLERDTYERLIGEFGADELLRHADGDLLARLSGQLLAMGVPVVALKLGEHGLYVRTSGDAERLAAMGRCTPGPALLERWTGRELIAPCFEVAVAGTTGAGDCTIAGFISGMVKGHAPEAVLTGAVAVGACNVEAADAVSGIRPWGDVERRIAAGWARRPVGLALPGWRLDEAAGLWVGPHDARGVSAGD